MKYRVQQLDFRNKFARSMWVCVYWLLVRFSPVPMHAWRAALLRMFGATIGNRVMIYPSAKIWAPWNLTMGEGSCLGPGVDCYCVDSIELGDRTRISQRAFLCTAGHDYNVVSLPLITAPIKIESDAWVTAEVYVGPGVTMKNGAVALARAVVVKDVDAWTVVAGNPSRTIRRRLLMAKDSKGIV